jgi:hypothetical protein
MNNAVKEGGAEKRELQGRAAFEAMFASIYEVVRYGGGINDMLWKFAARAYPQDRWIGEAMRVARYGKKECRQTAIEMAEAVVAEADRRKEYKLARIFRELVGVMRSS